MLRSQLFLRLFCLGILNSISGQTILSSNSGITSPDGTNGASSSSIIADQNPGFDDVLESGDNLNPFENSVSIQSGNNLIINRGPNGVQIIQGSPGQNSIITSGPGSFSSIGSTLITQNSGSNQRVLFRFGPGPYYGTNPGGNNVVVASNVPVKVYQTQCSVFDYECLQKSGSVQPA